MESLTREFLEQARSGQSLFLPAVREAYLELPEERQVRLDLLLTGLDGVVKRYCLAMPRFADCSEDEREFVLEFVLAQAFNILSCLGGRELQLYGSSRVEVEAVFAVLGQAFGLAGGDAGNGAPRFAGVVRVVNRMLATLLTGEKACFRLGIAEAAPSCRRPGVTPEGGAADILARAADGLEGRTFLGMDIGGTDIKLALAVDGRLRCLKEFDWFPGLFTSAEEFIRPLRALTRLMAVVASGLSAAPGLEKALRRDASLADIEAALAGCPEVPGLFDAIGLSFPDVVVADRIVGGESPKTLGMRNALGEGYDVEFARLTQLAGEFRPWVKSDRAVFIVNDGPMAAFTAGVELARVRPDAVGRGVFAHTLGTDFGTGWITADGGIPDIPLEVYSCMLDLGSYPERAYPADDVRSINNFNNNLPGTMQKFAGQSGVFRLAQKHLPARRPDLYRDLKARGFIVDQMVDGKAMLVVPTKPRDMRKPFLEHMMDLASRGDCPEVEDIFREIGHVLGMVAREIDWLLAPGLKTRTLFGRLVKVSRCFDLMREGARRVNSRTVLEAADDNMANTPLMRELAMNSEYTVAQFAQAVGAVYYANSRMSCR